MNTEMTPPPPDSSDVPAERIELQEHAIFALMHLVGASAAWRQRFKAVSALSIEPLSAIGLIHPTRRAQGATAPAMFADTDMPLGSDLHPAVGGALAGDRAHQRRDAISCIGLTDHGRSVLNGNWARPQGDVRDMAAYGAGHGLALPFTREERARIRAAGGTDRAAQAIEVEALDIVTFRAGVSVAIVRLRLQGPDGPLLAHLQEAVHVLSNTRRARSFGWACEAEPQGRFTLPDLVGAIVAGAQCRLGPDNRLYTYTYAQFKTLPPERSVLEIAAWRLSRHYTTAYLPGPGYLAGTAVVDIFQNVHHAAGMEGAATLAVADAGFVQTGFGNRLRGNYLPLVILAFHERIELLRISERAARIHARSGQQDHGYQKVLRRLVEDFLLFRLRYRVAVASDITMHNQFYKALGDGLDVGALTRKIVEDAREAARALQDRRAVAARLSDRKRHEDHLRRERHRAWILGVFAAMLTFLTTVTALEKLQELAGVPPERVKYIVAGVAIALALLSGLITGIRHADAHAGSDEDAPGDERESDDTDEVGEEIERDREGEALHVSSERLTEARAASAVAGHAP